MNWTGVLFFLRDGVALDYFIAIWNTDFYSAYPPVLHAAMCVADGAHM